MINLLSFHQVTNKTMDQLYTITQNQKVRNLFRYWIELLTYGAYVRLNKDRQRVATSD